uniref:Uncharacterized protein n=1 Tax=Ditylenchus dipsaci TaxID=166011 RepID=A0A915D500_9BILA
MVAMVCTKAHASSKHVHHVIGSRSRECDRYVDIDRWGWHVSMPPGPPKLPHGLSSSLSLLAAFLATATIF